MNERNSRNYNRKKWKKTKKNIKLQLAQILELSIENNKVILKSSNDEIKIQLIENQTSNSLLISTFQTVDVSGYLIILSKLKLPDKTENHFKLTVYLIFDDRPMECFEFYGLKTIKIFYSENIISENGIKIKLIFLEESEPDLYIEVQLYGKSNEEIDISQYLFSKEISDDRIGVIEMNQNSLAIIKELLDEIYNLSEEVDSYKKKEKPSEKLTQENNELKSNLKMKEDNIKKLEREIINKKVKTFTETESKLTTAKKELVNLRAKDSSSVFSFVITAVITFIVTAAIFVFLFFNPRMRRMIIYDTEDVSR